MHRYVGTGAVLGAFVVGAPLLLLGLRTPRDFEWVVALVVLAPFYLPVGAAAIGAGFAKGGVLAANIATNAALYAGAGWWLWRSSGGPLHRRVGPIVLAVAAVYVVIAAVEVVL